MSRNRQALCLAALTLICACLAGCTAPDPQPQLQSTSLMQGQGVANYTTAQAQLGTLTKEFSMSATVYYPHVTAINLTANEAQFVEFSVTNGQKVQKGDTLAVFRLKNDSVRLTAISLELDTLATSLADGLHDRKKSKDELYEQRTEITNKREADIIYRDQVNLQIIEKQLARIELETQQFELRNAEQQRALQAERRDIIDAQSELVIVAPMDGVVTSVQYIVPGVTCYRGQSVMGLYDPTQYLLRSDNGLMGAFRVGQEVTIEYGRNNNRLSAKGTVVYSDELLPTNLKQGGAAISVDGDVDPAALINPTVYSNQARLDNVLLLPKDAVYKDNGISFVRLLSDGTVRKRFVLTGVASTDAVMVLDGLQAGDTVIIE